MNQKTNPCLRSGLMLALICPSSVFATSLHHGEQNLMNAATNLNRELRSRNRADVDLKWREYLRAVDDRIRPQFLVDGEASRRVLDASVSAVFGEVEDEIKGPGLQRMDKDLGALFRERIARAGAGMSAHRKAYVVEFLRYHVSSLLVGISAGAIVGGATFATLSPLSATPATPYLAALLSSGLSATVLAEWLLKPLGAREKEFATRFEDARRGLETIRAMLVARQCRDELNVLPTELRTSL